MDLLSGSLDLNEGAWIINRKGIFGNDGGIVSNYNLLNLSPIEFEDLAGDLLQEHLGLYLESCKEGKDGGIDLRYSHDKNNHIIQCKRYNDFNNLKSNLSLEVEKVNKLNPKRYSVVTSVPLLPHHKSEIKKLFNPHILNTSDIYGYDDIINLLGLYAEIEKNTIIYGSLA